MNQVKTSRKKMRPLNEKKKLLTHLKIIEGQVRGVSKMVEENRYCDDILIQISAIQQSLKSLGTTILKNHLETCVVQNIKEDKLEIIDDVLNLMKRIGG